MIPAFPGRRQAIDFESQVRQYVIIDDVIEEYGIGVKCVSRQDDAIVECFAVTADGSAPVSETRLLLYACTRAMAVSRLTQNECSQVSDLAVFLAVT